MTTGKTIALLEKTLMLGKIEGKRRKGQQRWLDDSMDMSLSMFLPAAADLLPE